MIDKGLSSTSMMQYSYHGNPSGYDSSMTDEGVMVKQEFCTVFAPPE